MNRKLITCPETACFEVIEYERTPLGTLIASCSRLERCEVECARTCATRIDRHAETSECIFAAPVDPSLSEHT